MELKSKSYYDQLETLSKSLNESFMGSINEFGILKIKSGKVFSNNYAKLNNNAAIDLLVSGSDLSKKFNEEYNDKDLKKDFNSFFQSYKKIYDSVNEMYGENKDAKGKNYYIKNNKIYTVEKNQDRVNKLFELIHDTFINLKKLVDEKIKSLENDMGKCYLHDAETAPKIQEYKKEVEDRNSDLAKFLPNILDLSTTNRSWKDFYVQLLFINSDMEKNKKLHLYLKNFYNFKNFDDLKKECDMFINMVSDNLFEKIKENFQKSVNEIIKKIPKSCYKYSNYFNLSSFLISLIRAKNLTEVVDVLKDNNVTNFNDNFQGEVDKLVNKFKINHKSYDSDTNFDTELLKPLQALASRKVGNRVIPRKLKPNLVNSTKIIGTMSKETSENQKAREKFKSERLKKFFNKFSNAVENVLKASSTDDCKDDEKATGEVIVALQSYIDDKKKEKGFFKTLTSTSVGYFKDYISLLKKYQKLQQDLEKAKENEKKKKSVIKSMKKVGLELSKLYNKMIKKVKVNRTPYTKAGNIAVVAIKEVRDLFKKLIEGDSNLKGLFINEPSENKN